MGAKKRERETEGNNKEYKKAHLHRTLDIEKQPKAMMGYIKTDKSKLIAGRLLIELYFTGRRSLMVLDLAQYSIAELQSAEMGGINTLQ